MGPVRLGWARLGWITLVYIKGLQYHRKYLTAALERFQQIVK
jgi:hypothetical protein